MKTNSNRNIFILLTQIFDLEWHRQIANCDDRFFPVSHFGGSQAEDLYKHTWIFLRPQLRYLSNVQTCRQLSQLWMTTAVTRNTCLTVAFVRRIELVRSVPDRLLGPHYAIHLLRRQIEAPRVVVSSYTRCKTKFHNRRSILLHFSSVEMWEWEERRIYAKSSGRVRLIGNNPVSGGEMIKYHKST